MAPHSNAQPILSGRALLERPLELSRDTWGLDTVAGRFVEISGGAATGALTTCAGLIAEVQQRCMAAAWINGESPGFFPPDFAASGVDLAALPIIKAGEKMKACHVADTLVRTTCCGKPSPNGAGKQAWETNPEKYSPSSSKSIW